MRDDAYRYDKDFGITRGTRWADDRELKARLTRIDLNADHYPTSGLPLISDGRIAYVSSDDSHGLIVGSTGSKKTRLLGMPMMEMFARAGESVICTDPKGELYERTSGLYEKEGYDIKVINLRDPECSDGWNPLHEAAELYHAGRPDQAVGVINDLAATFFPENVRNVDPFWFQTSRSLFQALCEMVLEKSDCYPEVSLRTVQVLSEGLSSGYRINTRNLIRYYPEDSLARINLSTSLTGTDKTTENVLVSYKAGVQFLYSQQSLLNLLSLHGLRFSSIGARKTAVYIIMPDEKTTFHPLVSLFIKQCYERLIAAAQESENRMLPVRVNFLLDEFSNLPAIPDMSSMISAARSRNIRFYLIIQSLNQLIRKYSDDAETIRGNCNDWVYLTSREVELLKELETLCGTDTRENRPLISVSQLQRLDKQAGEALILCGRLYPYIGTLADIDRYPFSHLKPKPLPRLAVRPFDFSAMLQVEEQLAVSDMLAGRPVYSMDRFDDAWTAGREGKTVLFGFGRLGRQPLYWIAQPRPDHHLMLYSVLAFPMPEVSVRLIQNGAFECFWLQHLTRYFFTPEELLYIVPCDLERPEEVRTVLLYLPDPDEARKVLLGENAELCRFYRNDDWSPPCYILSDGSFVVNGNDILDPGVIPDGASFRPVLEISDQKKWDFVRHELKRPAGDDAEESAGSAGNPAETGETMFDKLFGSGTSGFLDDLFGDN